MTIRACGLAAVFVCAIACASPLAPSVERHDDTRVADAIAALRQLPSQWWTGGRSVAAWMDAQPVEAVVVRDLPANYAAIYEHPRIVVSAAMVAHLDATELAAILAHEFRHAEGYRHTCGERDAAQDRHGVWALHLAALDALGRADVASRIRPDVFCLGAN